jgi:DNA repair protein SbcD/Mre11
MNLNNDEIKDKNMNNENNYDNKIDNNSENKSSFKYAHLADLHLGSWRDDKMRELSTKAFLKAMDECLEKQVDFILFAGDLFNTSLPSVDILKIVTKKLKEVNDKNIPLYVIPGSHDFSPSGKTIIDVLENAGLLINVCQGEVDPETKELCLKFTIDQKTGTKITGMLGRKGQLDKNYYENLKLSSLDSEAGYKIFMFHTSVAELLPVELKFIESAPLSLFPKGFDYYAGGHIHHPVKIEHADYRCVTYTGALFPNNFQELEKYSKGGYYIVSVEANETNEINKSFTQNIEWIPLEIIKHHSLILNCNHKTAEVITFDILDYFNDKEVENSLITIRLKGSINNGQVSDINFKEIFQQLYNKEAYFIMKNTAKLSSNEFEEIKTASSNPETIEEETIKEHLQQTNTFDKETEVNLIKSLILSLNTTKKEGETSSDFQRRVEEEMEGLLNINREDKSSENKSDNHEINSKLDDHKFNDDRLNDNK